MLGQILGRKVGVYFVDIIIIILVQDNHGTEADFIESLSDYVRGRKQIPEIANRQRLMDKPPLRDIFRSEVLGDRRKRGRSIREAVLEHGYTQRELADHLRIHFLGDLDGGQAEFKCRRVAKTGMS